MKKILLFLAIAGLMNLTVGAQQNKRCYSDEKNRAEMLRDPQFARNVEANERYNEQQERAKVNGLRRPAHTGPYIIPLVFHIIHNYGPENVSDEVIRNTVQLMNEDYRKMNADTSQIISAFRTVAGDCNVEFRLATKDPSGNCTNGIEHIVTTKTYNANDASKLHAWPNNRYMNIWVAASLENSGAAAYAYYPGVNGAIDGVMCQYGYADNFTNTLTHEIGHSFNLKHVWGDSNDAGAACGDDLVSDTPETAGEFGCPLNVSNCNPPILENTQNFMDYTSCTCMFTAGQSARISDCLTSSIGGRNNLWTTANLILTGTNGTTPTCIPKPDFIADNAYACSGDSVHFTDLSWNANITSWNWTFPGGSPATSNIQNPSVAYATSGIYGATLKASSTAGSDSITKTSLIRVTGNALNAIPYVESFEDTSSFPGNDGFVINPDNGSTWSRVTNTGSTGTACIKINNFTNSAGSVDEWITPSFNFSNMNTPITMTFKVSHAQRNSGSNDELKIYYSFTCGQTWQSTSYSRSGASLATTTIAASNFTPSNASQWRQETIFINPVHNRPKVRFKFQCTSDHGNNIYIDDINITGLDNAVNDLDDVQSDISIYPNPTKGNSKISFTLEKNSNVKIVIRDIIGQTVSNVMDGVLSSGSQEKSLPVLSPGIYLVDLNVNNKHHVRKLVVS